MPLPESMKGVGTVSIVAVLVLHRCALEDAQAWKTLRPQIEKLAGRMKFALLVCENEATRAEAEGLAEWVEFVGRAENGGLAWAYNLGLQRAEAMGAEWLLTLDQDTQLPRTFIEIMVETISVVGRRAEIAAVVPVITGGQGRVYSPVIAKLGRERALKPGFVGVPQGDVRAFNSAAMTRVAWLTLVGGYPSLFWLDFLDHAAFRALGRAGGKVWVAGNLKVEHHLSLEEGRETMSEVRFVNFLQAESAFIDLYGWRIEGWLYTLRLCFRIRNQRRRGEQPFFAQQTTALLKRRLRWSRKQRLQVWMESQRTR